MWSSEHAQFSVLFFLKFRSFQLFSFHFAGLHFFFCTGDGVFDFYFGLLFCLLVLLLAIDIYCDLCFQKKIHFVNFGNFLFFKVWGSSIFFLSFGGLFTSKETGYMPFLMWILKVFYFRILKFRNLQFSSCHFKGFTCEEIMLGVLFLNLGGFKFVLMEFKDLQLCS